MDLKTTRIRDRDKLFNCAVQISYFVFELWEHASEGSLRVDLSHRS